MFLVVLMLFIVFLLLLLLVVVVSSVVVISLLLLLVVSLVEVVLLVFVVFNKLRKSPPVGVALWGGIVGGGIVGDDGGGVPSRESKLSIVHWDPLCCDLVPSGLHFFEGDPALKAGRTIFPTPPLVVADPKVGSCVPQCVRCACGDVGVAFECGVRRQGGVGASVAMGEERGGEGEVHVCFEVWKAWGGTRTG